MRIFVISLVLLFSSVFQGVAQSPGGVSTNLRWWLKANSGVFSDNGATPAVANSTAVQQWNDQSTIANHARQTTGGNKPVFNNAVINGYPALRFSSNQFIDGLALPGINPTDNWIFFMVFKQNSFTAGGTSDGGGTYLMDRTSGTGNLMSLKIVNTDKFMLQKRNDGGFGIGGPISTISAASSQFVIADYYRQFGTAYGLFINGKSDGTSGDDSGNLTGPTLRIGRHADNTNSGLNGDLAEVIMYNYFPTATQRQQIESYLAIKYGITLDQSDGGKDYLSSTGTTIYPATTSHAVYNNNIAGIGQDDGSALLQSSSQSQNNLSVLSVSSPSALTNGNFLLWGDDSPTITNSNNVPAPYINRLSRVWRAKTTGSVGTVTLSFDLTGLGVSLSNASRFALLTNTSADLSTATASTATRSISGNVVSFSGISISDGTYFSIATDIIIPVPGGVSGPLAWLRADNGAYVNTGITLATNGQTVQQWNNFQGSVSYNVSQATSGNRPTFLTNSANSNPVIRYSVASSSLDFGAMGISSSSSLESFFSIRPTAINSTGSVNDENGSYFMDRTTASNALFGLKASGTKFGYQKRNDASNGLGGVATTSDINTSIFQLVNMYRNYNVQYGIAYNGSIESTLADTDGPMTLPSLRLGNHATTNVGLVGDLPEFILYTRNLSTNERTRVNSYLALKYGVSLSQATATHYLASNSSIIFPSATSYSGFSTDVAGLGRDNVSSLLQLNSQSVNAGSMVNLQIASLPTDLSFLIWGSNNGSVTVPNTVDVQSPVLRRLARVWRVSNINSVGPVTVNIDLSTVPGAKLQADLRLIVDGDGVFNAGTTALTGTLVGNIFTVTNVTLANGNYFTIGSVSLSTPLPVQLTQFDVELSGENVTATWATASELNADFFEVQRSKEGVEYESIGKVKAFGTTTIPQKYSLDDTNPYNGISYYRLRQVDFDGTQTFSDVRSITIDKKATRISIFPNPVLNNQLTLQLHNWKEESAHVTIVDLMGKIVFQMPLAVARQTKWLFTLNDDIPTGVYLITVRGSTSRFISKIMVNK